MIKSIHTSYNGFNFRSRCEAKYAVFMDALGVQYRYETSGFSLSSGDRYLPDFWLPKLETWFEVKGTEPNEKELRKAEALAKDSGFPLIFGIGDPEAGMHAENLKIIRAGFNPLVSFWTVCEGCEQAIPNGFYHDCGPGVSLSISHFRLLSATRAARSARFEFGQKGAKNVRGSISPDYLRSGVKR